MRNLLAVGAATALTIGLGAAATPVAHAATPDYTIELLAPVAGTWHSKATAINDSGDVAGISLNDTDSPGTLWRATRRSEPVLIASGRSEPAGLSNNGVIVGISHEPAQEMGSEHGLLWKDGKVHYLDNVVAKPAGSTILDATGINSAGQIVGTIRLANNTLRAFIATPKAVDVYTTPGTHHVNGRDWKTTCEKYSQTTRCRTEIIATEVKAHPKGGGTYAYTQGNE